MKKTADQELAEFILAQSDGTKTNLAENYGDCKCGCPLIQFAQFKGLTGENVGAGFDCIEKDGKIAIQFSRKLFKIISDLCIYNGTFTYQTIRAAPEMAQWLKQYEA